MIIHKAGNPNIPSTSNLSINSDSESSIAISVLFIGISILTFITLNSKFIKYEK